VIIIYFNIDFIYMWTETTASKGHQTRVKMFTGRPIMRKSLWIIAILFAAVVAPNVRADEIHGTVTGKVTSGSDSLGLFGAPGANLTGDTATISFNYDPTAAYLQEFNAQTELQSYGNAVLNGPIMGVTINVTIGGVKQTYAETLGLPFGTVYFNGTGNVCYAGCSELNLDTYNASGGGLASLTLNSSTPYFRATVLHDSNGAGEPCAIPYPSTGYDTLCSEAAIQAILGSLVYGNLNIENFDPGSINIQLGNLVDTTSPVPAPEPGTIVLTLIGLGLLVMRKSIAQALALGT
jgi:hypothetical protein